MSSQLPIPPPGFDDLSIEEQMEYVEKLWNYIPSREDDLEVPEGHMQIIEERMARYGSTVEGTTWEEVEKELLKELDLTR